MKLVQPLSLGDDGMLQGCSSTEKFLHEFMVKQSWLGKWLGMKSCRKGEAKNDTEI